MPLPANKTFSELHPFITLTVTGAVILTVAATLLVLLIYKGWKTRTFRQYTLIYILLLNMVLVWVAQIPFKYLTHRNYETMQQKSHRISLLRLQPISTLIFCYKYFQTTEKILGRGEFFFASKKLKSITSFLFLLLKWLSFLTTILLVVLQISDFVIGDSD